MLVILGPTASGKTKLAARLAYKLNGEIISADSRQVYRRMDIGTGKDLNDYIVEGTPIPYHLIDIIDPGREYNIFDYQQDFLKAYLDITSRERTPVLCGGSGLYLQAVIQQYPLKKVPLDHDLRSELEEKSDEELTLMLKSYKKLHNITDLENRERLMRAIEIEHFSKNETRPGTSFPPIRTMIFGISYPRGLLKERITQRLESRLKEGMIEEVKGLLDTGILPERLIRYGLEYKYLTLFLTGKIDFNALFLSLERAIHSFAKRQMTWFRGMERRGIMINWIDGRLPVQEKTALIIDKKRIKN